MRKDVNRIIRLGLLVSLLLGCHYQKDEPEARTYYESLKLDTPESAVQTFLDAFRRDDFYTLFLIFSPWTQMRVENSINVMAYEQLIKVDNTQEAKDILSETPLLQSSTEWEHGGMSSAIYRFDALMMAAKQHSAFLIDLTGNATIIGIEMSGNEANKGQADVHVKVEGIEEEVTFRMRQAPSGRWRVEQVIVSGGDEKQVPWAVKTAE